ncbi:DUF86 domain-containing protein [Oceanobacillus luteolus]|uniref:DUF86 domain-containing protein n=1 Tax=Oceanobacillus luteolus TaxID=1274358 RepID=UPI00203B4F91|nr:DUF86 domain-containing protein [Oceanobacillus luteolus]MCM3739350.1 DUF86 domain-containing protein [Oceanobacillus luteolus]
MYFVDRNKIEEILTYMDELLVLLDENNFSTPVEYLARERIVHILIESTLDVGNMMIDGFIMRDPGSYEDIIDILIDEKVIPEEEEAIYKSFIELRKDIVTDYVNVDQQKIANTLLKSTPALKEFSTYIRTYLKNELGVANAFLKE